MSQPAWVPALAILIGVSAGALVPDNGHADIALVLVIAWIAGVCAFARQRRWMFLLCVVLGFAGAGYLLGSVAIRNALDPPVRRFFEEISSATPGAEPDAPFVVEGVLASDAAASAPGAFLRLEATHIRFAERSAYASGAISVAVGGTVGGDAIGEWRAGRRVRAPMLLRRPTRYYNFGVTDRERWQVARGAALSGYVKSAALVERLARGPWYAEAASCARAHARRAIESTVGRWSGQSAGVVTAIVIGDRAGLSAETERRLQEAGTYHVIAISGGNIAIFVAIVLTLARAVRLGLKPGVVLTALVLLAYAYIAGGGASVSRATMMAVVCLAARALDHRSSPLNGIACASALMLCLSPLTIFDAGFALTFGATIGIVLGVPHLMRECRFGMALRAAAALLAASLAAEAALLPIGAWLFARVTFAGLLLNFVAIPLMAVAQCAGLAAVVLCALPSGPGIVAKVAGYAAHLGATGLVGSASLLDVAPWLAMRVLPPPFWLVGGYYLAWGVWLWTRSAHHDVVMFERLRVVRLVAVAVPVAALVWIVVSPESALARAVRLQATFVDVGQGDSALLRFPGGQSLLVDSGGLVTRGDYDFGERVLAPALWGLKVTRIEHLALTHGDPDHIGGAPAVLRNFGVHELWEGVPVPPHPALSALALDGTTRGISWRTHRAGDRLRIAGTQIIVWHPPPPDWERQRVRNDDSLVIEVKAGDISVLLTGDIGRDVERDLAARIPRAPLRIVKVPHHGSLTSSSWEFLSAIRPDVAIVSAGRGNRYGHPVSEVIDRYRRIGALILRTDLDGAIQMETDGYKAVIKTVSGREFTRRSHR